MNIFKKVTLTTVMLFGALQLAACSDGESGALNLENFNANGDANWRITNNSEIMADNGKGYLVTKRSYQDFIITLEFYAAQNSNSGIFFRCEDLTEINDSKCYEANIFDTRLDQSGRTGAITNIAAPLESISTEGRWNTYEVEAKGNRLIVHLNGIKTIDIKNSKHSKGPIALQYMMGVIKFKNIKITEL